MYDPKEVLEICDKATPGEWVRQDTLDCPNYAEIYSLSLAGNTQPIMLVANVANADFIAIARTVLPELAKEVIKLRAVAEASRVFIKTLDKCLSNEDTCNINECCFCEFDYEPKIRELRKALADARYGGEE